MKILHYSEIDSTNLEAARLIESNQITEPTALYADRQISGRGSRGRTWESSKSGNLLVSYIFPIDHHWHMPHLAVYPLALGIRNFISSLAPSNVCLQIKWPNDTLLEDKKVSGALHEITTHENKQYFIAGIGINVAWHPENTHFPATNLHEHITISLSTEEMAVELSQFLNTELQNWQKSGFKDVLKRSMPQFYRYGEDITVYPSHNREAEITGIFDSIDENGALILKTAGNVHKITAADIFPSFNEAFDKPSS